MNELNNNSTELDNENVEYISRQDAIKVAQKLVCDMATSSIEWDALKEWAKEQIETLPSADVRENVRGKWIEPNNKIAISLDQWICSNCNNLITHKHNFCPNCGADMRGEI